MVAVLVDQSGVVSDNVDPAVSVVGQVNKAVLIPVGACAKKISKNIYYKIQIRKDSSRSWFHENNGESRHFVPSLTSNDSIEAIQNGRMGGICVSTNEYLVHFVEIRMGSCVKKYCLYCLIYNRPRRQKKQLHWILNWQTTTQNSHTLCLHWCILKALRLSTIRSARSPVRRNFTTWYFPSLYVFESILRVCFPLPVSYSATMKPFS